MEQILCINCKRLQSISSFYLQKGKPKTDKCKKCMSVYMKEKYKQGGIEKVRTYRAENPEWYKKCKDRAEAKRSLKRKTDENFREKINQLKRNDLIKNRKTYMLHRAKVRALKNSLEFTIEVEDIIIPEKCPLLNVKFINGTKGDYLYTPSLDRVDTTKGYTKSNIRVISSLANSMKNCATKEQLNTFIQNLPDYLNNKI